MTDPDIDITHVAPEDLRHQDPLASEPVTAPGWQPTRKWIAALAGSAASVVASWIVTGAFDDVERGMAATALVSLTAAYFQANQPTPGGVPERDL